MILSFQGLLILFYASCSCLLFLYLQSSLKPFIYKSYGDYNKENEYKKDSYIRLLSKKNTSLRKQKYYLQIKDQILNSYYIIDNIKFHTGVTHRFLPALICSIFTKISFCITNPEADDILKCTNQQQYNIYIKDTHLFSLYYPSSTYNPHCQGYNANKSLILVLVRSCTLTTYISQNIMKTLFAG